MFLLLGLVSSLLLAAIVPPFQAPDELAHLRRADMITYAAEGGFGRLTLGDKNYVTGKVHVSFDEAAAHFDPIMFHPEQKVVAAEAAAAALPRLDGRLGDALPGAAMNPLIYAPTVLTVGVARHFGWPALRTLYVARVLNAVASMAVGFFALLLAHRARLVLFALLMLPMSLALFGAVSQDGLLIAFAALGVALLSRAMGEGRPLRTWELVGAAVCLGLVAMAKLPCAAMCAILLFAPAEKRRAKWIAGLSALLLPVVWNLWTVARGWRTPVPEGMSGDGEAKVRLLLDNPHQLLPLVSNTYGKFKDHYPDQVIGVLGWLDTPLPEAFYGWAWAMLGLAFVASVSLSLRDAWRWPRAAAPVLALGGALAVFAALYLTWSPLHGDTIEGVQGRYFLPLAMLIPLAVEGATPLWGGDRARRAIESIAALIVLAFPLYSLLVVTQTVMARYYPQ